MYPFQEKQSHGFSLVELLLVLGILGIIFSFSMVIYQDQKVKSYQATGQGFVETILSEQLNYFNQQNTFTLSFDELGYGNVTNIQSIPPFYEARLQPCAGINDSQQCIEIIATPTPEFNRRNDLVITMNTYKECTGCLL